MGDNKDIKLTDEDDGPDESDVFEDTLQLDAKSKTADTSNVGDPSVELNVDEIVAELEADMGKAPSDAHQNARKRLEELLEERRAAREIEDIDELALDDF
ncbi:MAG: hypothetical protein KJO13_04670 [Gammaproteobacteria bacterium]|nr:hypothetical protein [Gammaproteobacteria bacterium]